MKRSQNVILPEMRKSWRQFSFAPISVAVASAMVAGCSDNSVEANIYESVDGCIDDNPQSISECKMAYQEALIEAERTAPKFRSLNDCSSEFGNNSCVQSSQNNWFMPVMAGFMFSRMLDNNRRYSQPMFTSRYPNSVYYNDWVTADGSNYGKTYKRGKVIVSKEQMKPKPTVKRTISRGGFGSTVSAKSSWSSSKSSSSKSSWGG